MSRVPAMAYYVSFIRYGEEAIRDKVNSSPGQAWTLASGLRNRLRCQKLL